METRYQRIAREQRERQEARAKRMEDASRKPRHTRKRYNPNEDKTPFGQGDNLGESPDY